MTCATCGRTPGAPSAPCPDCPTAAARSRFTMTATRIHELTQLLGERLADSGAKISITVVGGAAVALSANPDRSGTVDIDVFCNNRDHLDKVAAAIAAEKDLPKSWLNSDAQQFMSPATAPRDATVLFQKGDVTIALIDDRSLLAMKLRAGRGGKDLPDIETLLDKLGIDTVAEAEAIFDDYYAGEEEMRPLARELLNRKFTE